MTSRQRLLRFFAGRDVDRSPIWLLFPHHRTGVYADVQSIPCYRPILARIQAGDADTFDRRACPQGFLYSACPDVRMQTERDGRSVTTTMTYKDISLTKYTLYGPDTRVKFFVDDPEQLRRLLEIPYVPLQPDFALYRAERAETGEQGLYMLDLGLPLNVPSRLMDVGDFALATLTHRELIMQVLQTVHSRCLELYRAYLEADVCDAFFIAGSEYAGPPLVSPAMFSLLAAQHVREICDLIRSYGKIAIVHYHGNLRRVLPGMKEMNPHGLHTVEQPPFGDCTIAQAAEGLPGMALIGPIQYDDLIRLSPEQIEAQVQDAYRQAGGHPFILSPTAGPYEEHIDERAVRNYLAMIDTGLRLSKR